MAHKSMVMRANVGHLGVWLAAKDANCDATVAKNNSGDRMHTLVYRDEQESNPRHASEDRDGHRQCGDESFGGTAIVDHFWTISGPVKRGETYMCYVSVGVHHRLFSTGLCIVSY